MIVKSLARQQSEQKQLQKKILKSQQQSIKQLQKLSAQEFSCEPDARMAARQFSSQLKYHTLEAVEIIEQDHYSQPGRLGVSLPSGGDKRPKRQMTKEFYRFCRRAKYRA